MSKYQKYIHLLEVVLLYWAAGLLASCSSTKYLSEGEYLLDDIAIECDEQEVNTSDLGGYIKQSPNASWFNVAKVPLGIYNLSGKKDTWLNRLLKRIGEAPVVYDRQQADRSSSELKRTLQNMGYLGASVDASEEYKRHKVTLTYQLHPGDVYRINKITMDIADTTMAGKIEETASQSLLKPNMVLNINTLDKERERIATAMRNQGYYRFSKDYITYTADTTLNSKNVALTMHLALYQQDKQSPLTPHPIYQLNDVHVITEFDINNINANQLNQLRQTTYKGLDIHYRNSLILKPKIFSDHIFMREGEPYRADDVDRTYSSFGQLNALKYSNIQLVESPGTNLLDAFILTSPARIQSVTAELDGTNTAGDLGAAASVTYQHKNLFKGSETFTLKIRGAYEAISGLQGYTTNNYTEYGAEASLNFPRFMFPFLTSDFKRRIRASSEVGIQYNTQERPEFSRRVLAASWSYRWSPKQRAQHRFDLLDINYVYMPSVSSTFRDEYLNSTASNSILKYNYEDLFIMRLGHTYSYSSPDIDNITGNKRKSRFSIRTNIETSGNLLNLISHTIYERQTGNGQYAIGNIAYAQYIKGDFDYIQHFAIDKRNSISIHVGLGIAYPYGNSTVLPFEKRYFSGGANSVRGWSVRSLGPGRFSGGDKKIDFINQSGDMKLDVSLEYRTNLIGKLNGAIFVDAGNIWTLREYEEQPGGAFHIDSFLSEIAMAYGVGLRADLGFFILRFDFGMKAVNPVYPVDSRDHYPILHPDLRRDLTFHFAVGYPF
ncbi:MAG: BamA/TamA family outer membrane protein [Bacteroidaceae bacterium]|nr:BamA/TamA family outer membrane protein [Bacteroidaceae bacterium]